MKDKPSKTENKKARQLLLLGMAMADDTVKASLKPSDFEDPDISAVVQDITSKGKKTDMSHLFEFLTKLEVSVTGRVSEALTEAVSLDGRRKRLLGFADQVKLHIGGLTASRMDELESMMKDSLE